MAQDHINEPTEEQETPDTEATPTADAPLNRAQRRAQARGKASVPASPLGHPGGAGGSAGNRTGGHAGQVRFPRTGHK